MSIVELTAPGSRGREPSEKDRAVAFARTVLMAPTQYPGDMVVLARQFLRALGLSEPR
jgi:hypothetical protein